MKYDLQRTPEFKKWFNRLDKNTVLKVSARLELLSRHGYFGIMRNIDLNLFELKWRTGIRVYFCFDGKKILLLLSGGKKNDQKKDIKKAKSLQKKHTCT